MIKKLNEQKSWWKPYLNKKVILNNLKKTVNNNHITFSKNCYQIEQNLKKILGVKYVILTINGALHSKKNVTFIDNVKNSSNANYFSLSSKIKQKDILFITHLNGKSAYNSKTFKMIKKKKSFCH